MLWFQIAVGFGLGLWFGGLLLIVTVYTWLTLWETVQHNVRYGRVRWRDMRWRGMFRRA